jgi:hypothetical protein
MTERTAKHELRRWCPIAGMHQPADEIECNSEDCYDNKSTHNLRLRKMLVCSECEQGYFDGEDFSEHFCFSAY